MMELPDEKLKNLYQKVLASKVTFPQAIDANPQLEGEQELFTLKFLKFHSKINF